MSSSPGVVAVLGRAPARLLPIVEVVGLSKRFSVRKSLSDQLMAPFRRDRAAVLSGVSLEVRTGEFFGLLGPNGAGKTTLFKILATLVLPDEGTIRIDGFDAVREAAEVRRRLTPVIAEERSLHWRLTARENLRLFATLYGLRGANGSARIDELLEVVGLSDAGTKLVNTFSSGMKQRLLIARALLPRPRVLLLDEPTRSLDPISARAFRQFLRDEVAGRAGCTVLLATHNAEEALELCDRLAVLDRGRLLAMGTPAALAERFGDDRYRIVYHGGPRGSLAEWFDEGRVDELPGPGNGTGWRQAMVEIAGGAEEAGETLTGLVRAGYTISHFERAAPTLAELIERVVDRGGEGG